MLSGRQEAAAAELARWWDGLRQPGAGPRAVLLEVPAGWGRTAVLDQLAGVVGRAADPPGLVVRIEGRSLPSRPGAQALALQDLVLDSGVRRRAAGMLCAGWPAGTARLGALSLFASGIAAAGALLQRGLSVAAARDPDDSPGGRNGPVARAAHALAAVSARVPAAVLVDDADCLDPALALTLVESLIDHRDGRLLVVAAVAPRSDLAAALISRARYGPTASRVHRADADPRMGYASRADLAAELCPRLPAAAVRQLARRTQTFAEVFAAAGAAGGTGPAAREGSAGYRGGSAASATA
jgi:hypothetical protein